MEQFSTKVEAVICAVLYAVQCLVQRKQEGRKEEEKSSEENGMFFSIPEWGAEEFKPCKH